MADEGAIDDAYRRAEALVRDTDRDRWLASLFIPADKRRHVLALVAFSGEVARIRDVIREPMPGEIRLQWWRDVLTGDARGDVQGHPVAAALLDTIRRFLLPKKPLVDLIDARTFDLYDDPMPSLLDLEGYAGETVSALFQAAAMILCEGEDPRAADASGHAGVAWAMTGLMRALPIHARRGQVFIPEDILKRHGASPAMIRDAGAGSDKADQPVRAALAEMREHTRHHRDRALRAVVTADPRARPAYVALGLVEPYLKSLERTPPFGAIADIPGFLKPWHLWRTAQQLRST
ncbi:phytoene/squalene synthase family protein [Chthonobacter albigriseus]|uniref:phytoene/squalene synthase family protein n=1 Tax=Chthonobacter albigriseus TaxID=1683161 RepID=UPI0015EEBAD7|nr:phytoene/squalene synthase family protein [Chthonobacter albigriseus]